MYGGQQWTNQPTPASLNEYCLALMIIDALSNTRSGQAWFNRIIAYDNLWPYIRVKDYHRCSW